MSYCKNMGVDDCGAKEITSTSILTVVSLKMLLKEWKEKVFGKVFRNLESTLSISIVSVMVLVLNVS